MPKKHPHLKRKEAEVEQARIEHAQRNVLQESDSVVFIGEIPEQIANEKIRVDNSSLGDFLRDGGKYVNGYSLEYDPTVENQPPHVVRLCGEGFTYELYQLKKGREDLTVVGKPFQKLHDPSLGDKLVQALEERVKTYLAGQEIEAA